MHIPKKELKKMKPSELKVWQQMAGYMHPLIIEYAKGKQTARYDNMQRAMHEPETKFQVRSNAHKGPGGKAKDYETGIKEIVKFLPVAEDIIRKRLKEINKKFENNPITWGKMTWVWCIVLRPSKTDISLSANTVIEGKAKNGTKVQYYHCAGKTDNSIEEYCIIGSNRLTFSELYRYKI